MFNAQFNKTLCRALLALVLGAASLASAETLRVEVDTTSFGNGGWIDLMFNAANGSAPQATAKLSHFTGFNAGAGVQLSGGISGSLAGGYTLSNLNGGADLFQAINFGHKVGFNIDLAGSPDASANRAMSTFSVAVYGADQSTLLGHGDSASGSLLQLYWLPPVNSAAAGAVDNKVFDPVASVSAVTAVPEPSIWAMLASGLCLVGLTRRRGTY